MHIKMSHYSFLLSLLLLSLSLHPLSTSAAAGSFSVDLIHRDHSTKSPYHNPTSSPSDRLRSALQRSVSRSRTLFSSNASFSSQVIPNSFEYLMAVDVGTPPFKILAIADTGSDLIWTQCEPCTSCYKQNDPIFDSAASSTYKTESCESVPCAQLPDSSCSNNSLCEYQYSYGDRSFTKGILSTETFTLGDGSAPNILFGCSHESKGSFDENGSGLVGLGGGPLSLVSQLGPAIDYKFSYCLVPFSSNNGSSSTLNFGDKAVVEGGVRTPIIPGNPDTFFYLSLDAITVGNETVEAARPSGTVGQAGGNIVIDSGTTLTILSDSVLDPVIDKVADAVEYPRVEDPQGLLDLCFNISGAGDELELPELAFQFGGNATVKLQPFNAFVALDEETLCLAFASNAELGQDISIFGNIAQQNFHIGYDLKEEVLTIAPASCENF